MPIYMGIFEKPHVLDRKFRGEVKAKGYEGWIALQSAQLGTNRNITTSTGRGTNREASAPTTQEIVITKLQDSVSTALYRETLDGEGKLIVIAFVKEDGTSYTTIVLQNTLISSYSVSGHGGVTELEADGKPLDQFHQNHLRDVADISEHHAFAGIQPEPAGDLGELFLAAWLRAVARLLVAAVGSTHRRSCGSAPPGRALAATGHRPQRRSASPYRLRCSPARTRCSKNGLFCCAANVAFWLWSQPVDATPILNRRDRDYVLMSEKCRQRLTAAEKPELWHR